MPIAPTIDVRMVERRNRKGKKHKNSNKEMLLDPTPSEALIYHPFLTTKQSDNDHGEDPIYVTPGEEWIPRVQTTKQAMEKLGRHMNVVDNKLKTLEEFTLNETDNIRKKLEGRQRDEFEMMRI